jgi:hypothetical protein
MGRAAMDDGIESESSSRGEEEEEDDEEEEAGMISKIVKHKLYGRYFTSTGCTGAQKFNELSVLGIEGVVSISSRH